MARAKAKAETTQMARDMAEDRGALRSVKRAIAPAARGLRFATRHNRLFEEATFLALVALAAGSGSTTGGCPGLRGLAAAAGRVPTAEWARVAMRTCDAGAALRALRSSAARQLRALRRRGEIPAEIVVALGMHGIPRYGRTALGWLVRGRREGGTSRREKYMTAQCVTNRMWVTPGAVRVMPGDSVEVAFSTVYRRVRAVCRRAGVGPVLLMDREFFTTGVIGRPGGTGVRWAMLCPNRPRVAKALREYAARRRRRVSEPGISDGRGRVAPHAMAIARRRNPEGESPEETYIAFAVSGPSFDVESLYPRRWGIEIGYKMARQTRIRTSSRDERVRIFCFVLSLMVHNAWTMMHSDRRARGDSRRIPRAASRILLVLEACGELGIQAWRRPPRKPPP